jgi:hypothetical protein
MARNGGFFDENGPFFGVSGVPGGGVPPPGGVPNGGVRMGGYPLRGGQNTPFLEKIPLF